MWSKNMVGLQFLFCYNFKSGAKKTNKISYLKFSACSQLVWTFQTIWQKLEIGKFL